MKNILNFLIIILLLLVACKKDNTEPTINEEESSRIYRIEALRATSDGGLLAAGKKQEKVAFLKFDENCNLEWEKDHISRNTDPWFGSLPVNVKDMFELDNGDFLAFYFVEGSMGLGTYYLMRLDKDGNQIWKKGIYTGPDIYDEETVNSIIEGKFYTLDPNDLIVYDLNSFERENIHLSELDTLTTEEIIYDDKTNHFFTLSSDHMTLGWFKKCEYSISGELINKKILNLSDLSQFILLANNGMIFLGYPNEEEISIIRITETCDTLWTVELPPLGYFTSNAFQSVSQTEFIIKGQDKVLYMNIDGDELGLKEITEDDNLFFQNNDFVFQTFLDDDYNYWVTKTPFNEFFSK